MKKINIDVAGVSIDRSVPSSPDEYDKAVNAAANPKQSALGIAVTTTLKQKDIPAILRLAVVGRAASNGSVEIVGLEKATGIPRLTEQRQMKAGKGGKQYTRTVNAEDDAEYIERVFSPTTRTPEQVTQLTNALNAASAALPFGSGLPERAGIDKPLKGKWIKEAQRFLASPEALTKVQASFKAALGRQYTPVVPIPVNDPKNVQALGRLLRDFTTASTNALHNAFKK